MNTMSSKGGWAAAMALAGAVGMLASCKSMEMMSGQQVTLSGNNEVPAVATSAAGSGTVTIKEDRSVSAHIMVNGMTATAAHIH